MRGPQFLCLKADESAQMCFNRKKDSILRNIGGNSIKFILQILALCEKFGKKEFFEVRDFLLTNSKSADPETNDVNRKIHFGSMSDSADRAGTGGWLGGTGPD